MKVSSSVPHRRQVIHRKQQNVQTRGFLKTPNSSIPSLCHLNPFTDLSAPMDSISPFQRNGELLDRSRLHVMHHLSRRIKMPQTLDRQQRFEQWCQAYQHSARHREVGKPSAIACGNAKLAKTVRSFLLIHPLTV